MITTSKCSSYASIVLLLKKMAVKDAKKKTCKKVILRRNAVNGRFDVSFVSSPEQGTRDGIPPVTSRPISPLSPIEGLDNSPNVGNREAMDDTVDYSGLSIDWILDSPHADVSRLLRRLDETEDADLIMEMLLHFSLVIKGLPECPDEDLPLAVYFFIEDTFSIPSRLVECVKLRQYDGKMNVGVVFDSIRMKYEVLNKDELLEGTEVRMVNNHTLAWFERDPDETQG